MDPDHQHLLVVGAVEDADVPARWQLALVAPQIVMVELLGRGGLEAVDLHTLGVHAAHDVANGAVFARCIHGLEHDDDAVGVLRGQPPLVLGEEVDSRSKSLLLLRLLDVGGDLRGVEVLRKVDRASGLHPERLDELPDSLGCYCCHCWFPSSVAPVISIEQVLEESARACNCGFPTAPSIRATTDKLPRASDSARGDSHPPRQVTRVIRPSSEDPQAVDATNKASREELS